MGGHGRGWVGEPAHHHAVVLEVLARLRQLAVAPAVGGHVDDDRSLDHALDHGRGDEDRGLAARDRGGGDHHVGRGHLVADQLALAGQELLGLHPGVSARALLGLELELDEGGAERLHLFLGRGPDVVGAHLGPEAPGGGDGLQAGHARAEHEHLGGRDGARRGHEHGEELGQAHRGRPARRGSPTPSPATTARPSTGPG